MPALRAGSQGHLRPHFPSSRSCATGSRSRGRLTRPIATGSSTGISSRETSCSPSRGAKLLDFGLAKLRAPDTPVAAASELSALATGDKPLAAEGSLIGTFQYMAPEQLEGKEPDARADIFAFGALLHEMATGERAFKGKSQASLIAAILASEPPPISRLQPLTLAERARPAEGVELDPGRRLHPGGAGGGAVRARADRVGGHSARRGSGRA